MKANPTASGGIASSAALIAGSPASSPASRCQSAAGSGAVGAVGTHQIGGVARLHRRRPRARHPVLTVDDEVDADLAAFGVDVAHGVGPDDGLVPVRHVLEAVEGQRRRECRHVGARLGQHDLDVGVGVVDGRERARSRRRAPPGSCAAPAVRCAPLRTRGSDGLPQSPLRTRRLASSTIRAAQARWLATCEHGLAEGSHATPRPDVARDADLPRREAPLAVATKHQTSEFQRRERAKQLGGRYAGRHRDLIDRAGSPPWKCLICP